MIILNHATLIIDDVKKAISGAINIKDDYIDKVYLVASKIEQCDKLQVLNLENHIIMPYFISEQAELKFIDINLQYINQLVDLKDDFYVYSSFDAIDDQVIASFRKHKIIIDDLFIKTPNLGINKANLSNLAFSKEEPYVFLNMDYNFDESIINLILKNIPYNRLIIKSKDMIKTIKDLHFKYQVDLVDIVAFVSLNMARFLNIQNQYGSITRGKYANLLILDEKLNLVKKVINGQIID